VADVEKIVCVKSLFHKIMSQKIFSRSKYYAGPKLVTISDPVFFKSLFEAKHFIPLVSPLKVTKDGTVMYLLQVRDVNRDVVLDVVFQLPEEISSSVKLGSAEGEEEGLQAIWETSDAASDSYKSDVNRLLDYWLKQIQHANEFNGDHQPDIHYLSRAAKLKWPWKSHTNEEYFRQFRSDLQTHQLRLGVGYFSPERGAVGVTLQLSNYPGKSEKAILESGRRKGKRARSEEKEEGEESVPEISSVSIT
jgi:hypothetical protein